MSTHNICFHGEIRKILTCYPHLSSPNPIVITCCLSPVFPLDAAFHICRQHCREMRAYHIATDKREYPHNIFLISRQNHMLLVLI